MTLRLSMSGYWADLLHFYEGNSNMNTIKSSLFPFINKIDVFSAVQLLSRLTPSGRELWSRNCQWRNFCLQIIIDIISSIQLMNLLRNSKSRLPLLDRKAFQVVTRSFNLTLFSNTNSKESMVLYIYIYMYITILPWWRRKNFCVIIKFICQNHKKKYQLISHLFGLISSLSNPAAMQWQQNIS